jgi:hypothetical protein
MNFTLCQFIGIDLFYIYISKSDLGNRHIRFSQVLPLSQHHLGDDNVAEYVRVYETCFVYGAVAEYVRVYETCFVYGGPTFRTDHKALDPSKRNSAPRQNLNYTVYLDPVQAAYQADHRHRDP